MSIAAKRMQLSSSVFVFITGCTKKHMAVNSGRVKFWKGALLSDEHLDSKQLLLQIRRRRGFKSTPEKSCCDWYRVTIFISSVEGQVVG